jgi:hypothetical protein
MVRLRSLIVGAVVLAACGGESKDSGPGDGASPLTTALGQAPDLDACAILRGMDLSTYLGAPAETFKESVRSSAGSAAATMCGASPAGGLPLLTLMLRYRPLLGFLAK